MKIYTPSFKERHKSVNVQDDSNLHSRIAERCMNTVSYLFKRELQEICSKILNEFRKITDDVGKDKYFRISTKHDEGVFVDINNQSFNIDSEQALWLAEAVGNMADLYVMLAKNVHYFLVESIDVEGSPEDMNWFDTEEVVYSYEGDGYNSLFIRYSEHASLKINFSRKVSIFD